MSATGLLIGVLNILVVVLVLVLIGALLEWVARYVFDRAPLDPIIRKLYLAVVAVIAIIMLVELLLGVPFPLRVIG